MSKGNYRDMWVYAERKGAELSPVAKEMVSEARRLMDKYNRDYNEKERVVAVVIGSKVDAAAKQALEHGADVVVQLDHPELEHFRLAVIRELPDLVGRVEAPRVECCHRALLSLLPNLFVPDMKRG